MHIELLNVLIEGTRFVSGEEHILGLSNLDFTRKILILDESLDLLNSLNAVQTRHHKVRQDIADLFVSEEQRRSAQDCFLSVVDKLALVDQAKGCELLLDDLHVVELVFSHQNDTVTCKRVTKTTFSMQTLIGNQKLGLGRSVYLNW